MDADFEYYSRRAEQESELATRAQDEEVAAVHQGLAMLYKDRLASMIGDDDVKPQSQRSVLSICV